MVDRQKAKEFAVKREQIKNRRLQSNNVMEKSYVTNVDITGRKMEDGNV
jgi:hypothetical protein